MGRWPGGGTDPGTRLGRLPAGHSQAAKNLEEIKRKKRKEGFQLLAEYRSERLRIDLWAHIFFIAGQFLFCPDKKLSGLR